MFSRCHTFINVGGLQMSCFYSDFTILVKCLQKMIVTNPSVSPLITLNEKCDFIKSNQENILCLCVCVCVLGFFICSSLSYFFVCLLVCFLDKNLYYVCTVFYCIQMKLSGKNGICPLSVWTRSRELWWIGLFINPWMATIRRPDLSKFCKSNIISE